MQQSMKKALSCLLVLVMVLSVLPGTVFASEAASHAELPTSMEGLSIAYPYITENLKINETPVSRFDALTFESARNEVESAQMILTPGFNVTDFELTMHSMTNEKGNVIPAWAFEVYIQHYYNATGTTNTPNFGDFKSLDYNFITNRTYVEDVFHPRSGGGAGWSGVYPDALIPQDAAIAAGENTIAAGENQGIWVNLNVQGAAPGTYTGYSTLSVNGTDMQIPVSIRIYDVELPEEVHTKTSIGIWWDQLQAGEGYITQDLADSYYDYLVSKRIQPWDRWNYWYDTDRLVTQVVSMASDPAMGSYLLYYTPDGRTADRASVVTTLTAVINKNIELAQAGSSIDLFKKAYFYFACVDEPAGGSSAPTYAQVQAAIDVLDSVKSELAPMLDAYPGLKTSFLGIKNIVTGPNPTDAKNDLFYIDGCPDYSTSSALTSTYDSVLYCPQYQNMQTAEQRAKYADDTEVWWYGCCHPINPYPTFHINSPLVNSRALGFMMYEYGISGQVYSSANYWGAYKNDTIVLHDYWNGYDNYTPGDQILVYPGSDYGVEGPIGSIRIENIRESNEDYEYLWLLENTYGISDISAYTAGLYEGTIVTGVYDGQTVDPDGDGNTDASDLYHTRRVALLSKLEQLNVAANGATTIVPGNEGFVRGDRFTAGKDTYFDLEDAAWKTLSFDYKTDGAGELAVIIRGSQWTKYYGDYRLNENGEKVDYPGVTTEKLDDGYIRVTFNIDSLTRTGCAENLNYQPSDVGLLDIFQWSTTGGYIDNIQLSMDAPEEEPQPVVRGKPFTAGKDTYFYLDEPGAWDYVSFEYKIEGTGELAAILRGTTWTTYYGDFRLNENGEKQDYPGVTTEVLEDGYIRVTFDIAALNRSGCVDNRNTAPVDIKLIDIFGAWTTVEGYIDNIQVWNKEIVIRGEPFTAGKDTFFYLEQAADYATLSFDYWTEGAGEVAVIMRGSQWSKFYGDFRLTEKGEKVDYAGITTEVLEDGYIHVTFDIAALQRSGCANNRDGAPVDIKLIDIYNWTTINGYIDNIQYATHSHSHEAVVTAPTCTQDGYTTYTCSCGDSYVADEVAATGHNYEAVVTAPTPSAQGYTTHTCTICGDSYVDSYTDYKVEGYLSLTEDMHVNLSLTEDFYVNLNGHTMTGIINTNGFKVYGIDTLTDEYTCENMGYFNCVDAQGNEVVPESNNKTELTGSIKRYLTIETEKGYTFHRFYIGISHMTLKPGATGVGYKAIFGGDDMVKSQLHETEAYGYQLWIDDGNLVSCFKSREEYTSGKSLTLVLKNFDVENHGETVVYATVCIKLADGTTINSSDYSLTLRGMVETINDNYTAYNETQLQAVRDMIDRNPVMQTWSVENLYKPEVIRGQAFTAGKDTYFTVKAGNWDVVSFEYKTAGAGDMTAILRGSAWGSTYYGEFRFTESGEKYDYAGITTVVLDDGYIRVIFDVTALNRTGCVDNLNLQPADIALIDIFGAWTTVDGYIDNIQVSELPSEEVNRGEAFEAGVTKTKYMDIIAQNNLTFDYKLTTGGDMHVILRAPDWNGFYGDFEFNANGEAVDYDGITTEKLDDGYIRVTVVFSKLNRTGCVNNRDSAPANVGIFDIYSWGTANGYVDNIQVDVQIEEVPEIPAVPAQTTSFEAGKGVTTGIPTAYQTVTFDYQLTTDGVIGVILRDANAWLKFYGEFYFNANGETVDYAGITTQILGNGYIRVTMNLAELTRSGCVDNRNGAPEKVGVLDIYGGFSTANGNFGNVTVDP